MLDNKVWFCVSTAPPEELVYIKDITGTIQRAIPVYTNGTWDKDQWLIHLDLFSNSTFSSSEVYHWTYIVEELYY